jgi:hypothetical protein
VAGEVLEVGGSETQRARTIEEACGRAHDWEIKKYILSQCSHEYLQSKLSQLVSKGLWGSVGFVLAKGVSDTQHQYAIVEASKRAGEGNDQLHITSLYW